MGNRFLNIGFNNLVNVDKIISILASDNSTAKKLIFAYKEKELALDCANGRRVKSLIVTNEKMILLSGLNSTTLGQRLNGVEDILDKINLENEDE